MTLNTRAPAAHRLRPAQRRDGGGKLAELDGLRGVASLVVVAWHFIYAFMPQRTGIVPGFDPATGWLGNPLFAVLNGPGAVMLFFALSGYVLPLGYFRSGRTRAVLRAVAKRWFRLAGLTLIAAVGSYLLFRFGLYGYRETAAYTHSGWLGSFGGGDVNGGLRPSLPGAVLEGVVFAFTGSADAYNPVFWTMRDELFGSLMVFGLAVVLRRCRLLPGAALLVLAAAATQVTDPRLAAFVAGLALSWTHARGLAPVSRWLAPICLASGLALFGYLEPRDAYAWLGFLHDASAWRYDRIWLHTLGGVLLILGVRGSGRAGLLLASGPGRLLGRLSFPVYLFHFPLLCSWTCWLFLAARPAMPQGAAVAVAGLGTLPALLAVGYAFARLDEWWVARLDRVARKVIVVPDATTPSWPGLSGPPVPAPCRDRGPGQYPGHAGAGP